VERKGLIVGAVLAIAGALAVGVYSSADDGARNRTRASAGEELRDEPRSSDRPTAFAAPAPPSAQPTAPRAQPAPGVFPGQPAVDPLRPGLVQPLRPEPGQPARALAEADPRRFDPHRDRSAGWRLGRARAQTEIVQERIASLRERFAEHTQAGNVDLAVQQREIIQRFENRLTLLREETRTLEAEATADGTIGEAEQGFSETRVPERPGVVSPRAPGE
jgi:hypothetical protein